MMELGNLKDRYVKKGLFILGGYEKVCFVARLLVMFAAMMPSVSVAQAPSVQRPQVLSLRAEENWSALEDEHKRTAPFDRIKYLSLGAPNYNLTLGGELQLLYRLFINEAFGAIPQDDSGSLLLRIAAHSSFRLGKHFRMFGDIKSGIETGRDGGPRPFDEDRLDLHQGFAEISTSNTSTPKASRVLFRIGRQELVFGAERMFSTREGQNIRRSFDALNLRIHLPQLRIDTFAALEVPIRPGVFDDGGGERPLVWGSHATFTVDWPALAGVLTPITLASLRLALGTVMAQDPSFGIPLACAGGPTQSGSDTR